jgi:flagellar biosynthetic protein FliR
VTDLDHILGAAAAQAASVFLVFLRIGAAVALLPAFGEQSIPARVRTAIAICFTAVVAPAALPSAAEPDARYIAAAGVEVLVGLAFGIALRLMIHALQIAGTIAANMTSLSQLFAGAAADPQPAMSHLLVIGGLALAASAGLHVKVAAAFIDTYRIFPLGAPPGFGDLAAWGTARVGEVFALAFVLAAPFSVAALVANLALGAINRAMPQLMVAFVGAPATVWAALALLALAAPVILAVWSDALDRLLATTFGGA